jgi:hypothetical protein
MKDTIEKRLQSLELWKSNTEHVVSNVTICCANMITQMQRVEEELHNLIADIEADGDSHVQQISKIKRYLSNFAKFLHALDAKNTALATVMCREMELDPDMMTKEYARVMDDFKQIENLLEKSKGEPKRN